MRKVLRENVWQIAGSKMRRKEEQRIVKGKERTLQYTLIRKSVKNLNMRVKPEGVILIRFREYSRNSDVRASAHA